MRAQKATLSYIALTISKLTKNPIFHKLWKVGKYCGIILQFIVESHFFYTNVDL